MKFPTLKDVGMLAGVSAKTASNVLNGAEAAGPIGFSPEAGRRVREAAKQLAYTRNRFAQAMRTKRSNMIGFVAVNYSKKDGQVLNHTIFPLLVGLNHVFTPLRKHVALVELDEFDLASDQLPTVLRDPFFDGLIIHFGLPDRMMHLLDELSILRVYWDSGLSTPHDSIYREEDKIASLLTDRLIAAGHRRIALILGISEEHYRHPSQVHHFSVEARQRGYRKSMEREELEPLIMLGRDPNELSKQILNQKCTAALFQYGDQISLLWPTLGELDPAMLHSFAALACDVETSVVKTRGCNIGGATCDRYQAGHEIAHLLLRKLAVGGAPLPSIALPFEIKDGDFLIPHVPAVSAPASPGLEAKSPTEPSPHF